jgi:hypothetical protein
MHVNVRACMRSHVCARLQGVRPSVAAGSVRVCANGRRCEAVLLAVV